MTPSNPNRVQLDGSSLTLTLTLTLTLIGFIIPPFNPNRVALDGSSLSNLNPNRVHHDSL